MVSSRVKMVGAWLALALLAAAVGGIAALASHPTAAGAATGTVCGDWYVNGDEMDRKPTQALDGLTFAGDDLVHHAVTGLSVAGLAAGTFVAAPAPDQPSFFSVEVGDAGTYVGYATLRWNPATGKWVMVTGGQAYENASPAALVAMTSPAKSTNVLSFGVGYTHTPPGTVVTTVKSVTFNGTTYSPLCAPAVSASASASASATPLPPVGAGRSDDQLALTGTPVWALAGAGAVLLAVGCTAVVVGRRRRVRFGA